MQLNDFTDYSLRVLIYAAARPDRLCATSAVAAAFGISRHHVVKVVHTLQQRGYLETTRGRGGGFRLAQPPERIRLSDVIRSTEGTLALVECFSRDENTCPLTAACGLKRALGDAFAAFFDTLDRWSLADIVGRPRWAARARLLHPASIVPARTGAAGPRRARTRPPHRAANTGA
jgi:Rrf2 family nitric oxide-sensitive transcriptional repressor